MKRIKQLPLIFLLSGLLGFAMPGLADDTDIFLSNPAITGTRPNVLIILDNSANWGAALAAGTKFDAEVAALNTVLGGLDGKFNVGLMLFGETGGGNKNPVTSYIRYAVRTMDATNSPGLQSLITGLNTNSDKSSNAPYGFGLLEAFKYFGGGTASPQDATHFGPTAFGGFGQQKRDYAAFTNATSDQYVSPIVDGCAKNYIIYLSNGLPQSGADDGKPKASELLTNVRGNTTPIPLSNNTAAGNIGDEYARFLYGTDVSSRAGQQNINTYTIFPHDPTSLSGNDKANIVLLKSMANQGHGKYFAATDTASLINALTAIFNEIQAVDSVFASVTLPVSVNVRGTNLNQVYMGVFRPDENLMPRWLGNLKEYKLAYDTATKTLYLVDSQGLAIENPVTGFVVDNAVSYWTKDSAPYWEFKYFEEKPPRHKSDMPDGPLVEKGAAAQRLRESYATDPRKLYTCIDCTAGSLSSAPFAESNAAITQAMLGAANDTERAAIINWVRGQDNWGSGENNESTTDVRPSIHGDVLHSRPAVVNYNRYGTNNDTMVYYGANDGIFHAVKGGQGSCAAPENCDGEEKWGFVAEEFFSQLKRLREQTPIICSNDPDSIEACVQQDPSLPPDPLLPKPKPYFFDGSVGVYQEDMDKDGKYVATDGDKVYIYLTMRRGGRAIYALDVTEPDTPKFLWKISDTDFPELGYTWSYPKLAKIKIKDKSDPTKEIPKVVVIFGAGYDPNQDDLTPPVADTMGRGIFVVDAFDGTLIWQAGPGPSSPTYKTVSDMLYSIPADVTVINSDVDSYDDRMYVGDTGGNVWRVDIAYPDPANWAVNKLAAVGNTRKFLHAPDAVPGEDGSGTYDAVLIGSGDREHPFDTTVTNRFYMLKDRPIFEGATISESDDLVDQTTSQNSVPVGKKGWFITLGSGEKTVGGNAVTRAYLRVGGGG
jgi:type IV pilus assembly protein PilY1